MLASDSSNASSAAPTSTRRRLTRSLPSGSGIAVRAPSMILDPAGSSASSIGRMSSDLAADQLVHVVEHEDERLAPRREHGAELLERRRADGRRSPPQHRHTPGIDRFDGVERQRDVGEERGGVVLHRGQRDPCRGACIVGRHLGEERGLAVAGRRGDDHDVASSGLDVLEQGRARDGPRRRPVQLRRGRDEPDRLQLVAHRAAQCSLDLDYQAEEMLRRVLPRG